ncbi:hypothetical protein Dimus_001558 [Dionaea muscipula]
MGEDHGRAYEALAVLRAYASVFWKSTCMLFWHIAFDSFMDHGLFRPMAFGIQAYIAFGIQAYGFCIRPMACIRAYGSDRGLWPLYSGL